jgi:hypothetical protein
VLEALPALPEGPPGELLGVVLQAAARKAQLTLVIHVFVRCMGVPRQCTGSGNSVTESARIAHFNGRRPVPSRVAGIFQQGR